MKRFFITCMMFFIVFMINACVTTNQTKQFNSASIEGHWPTVEQYSSQPDAYIVEEGTVTLPPEGLYYAGARHALFAFRDKNEKIALFISWRDRNQTLRQGWVDNHWNIAQRDDGAIIIRSERGFRLVLKDGNGSCQFQNFNKFPLSQIIEFPPHGVDKQPYRGKPMGSCG